MNTRSIEIKGGLVGVALLVLAACGGSSSTASSSSPTPSISFTMMTEHASGVTGTGKVSKGKGTFLVRITLSGLDPNSSHVSHIHSGSCAAPGGILYALSEVVADSSGKATATTILSHLYVVPSGGWYVNVHKGPDLTQPAYGPNIACGDLPAA
jgi:hypothetical protein